MIDIPCYFATDKEEFKHYVGREPESKEELESWAYSLKKGMDAQLDWDIICSCASEEFK